MTGFWRWESKRSVRQVNKGEIFDRGQVFDALDREADAGFFGVMRHFVEDLEQAFKDIYLSDGGNRPDVLDEGNPKTSSTWAEIDDISVL